MKPFIWGDTCLRWPCVLVFWGLRSTHVDASSNGSLLIPEARMLILVDDWLIWAPDPVKLNDVDFGL